MVNRDCIMDEPNKNKTASTSLDCQMPCLAKQLSYNSKTSPFIGLPMPCPSY